MQSLPQIIHELGGAATRQQLLACGPTGYDITRAVRAGEITRIRQARYVLNATPREIVAAVRVGGMLAGPSAVRTFGLWSGLDRTLHVAVNDHAARLRLSRRTSDQGSVWSDRPRMRIQLHWVPAGRVPELGPECWRVPVGVALRQTVEWSPRETALACLDTALGTRVLSRTQLLQLFTGADARCQLLAREARTGSESGPESLVRRRLEATGLVIRQQVEVAAVGRVDMIIVGTNVVVEVDGRTYHEDPEAFERDRRRDAELAARGLVVVRLSFMRVMSDWRWCQRMVLAAAGRFPT